MFAHCTGDSDQIKLLQIYFLKIHHAEIPCMGHKNHARQKSLSPLFSELRQFLKVLMSDS